MNEKMFSRVWIAAKYSLNGALPGKERGL